MPDLIAKCSGCGDKVSGIHLGLLAASMNTHDHECPHHQFERPCDHAGNCYTLVRNAKKRKR